MDDKQNLRRTLNRIAFGSTLMGRKSGRVFAGAARTLSKVEGDLREAHAAGKLAAIRGIGPAIIAVVDDVLAGRTPDRLAEIEREVPEGLFALQRVPGLGAKRIATLWQELGITSLAELEYACTENRLVELEGFGDKMQTKILTALDKMLEDQGRLRRDQVGAILSALLPRIEAIDGVQSVEVVGDYKRGAELSDGIELLALAPGLTADRLAAALDATPEAEGARLTSDGADIRIWLHNRTTGLGGARVVRTGSAEHLQALEGIALEDGLDWVGILDEASTEDEVYAAFGLHTPPAERRELGVPFVPRSQPRPSPLIRMEDLRGALHNHTTASDGVDSLQTMRAAAGALGLTYLGISEHSETASYAGGLTARDLLQQRDAIHAMNAEDPTGCELLAGIESDILADGALDYAADLLQQLDFVIASVHARHGQGGEAMTQRMTRAASDPMTDVIGHPTGRLLLGRPPTELDVAALIEACAASGCAIELNASPHRLDLEARYLAMAKEAGVLVSIAADAHSARALGNLEYGIAVARRAGLTPEDVLNTRSVSELRSWVQQRRARAGV